MRRKSRSAFSLLGLLASVACHTAPPPSSAAWRAPKHAKPPNPDAVTSSSDSSETGSEHPDAGELAIVEVETLRHAFGGQPLGVTVNDVHVGVTPLVVRLPAGSYTLVGAAPKGSHDVGIMLTPGARRRVVFSEGGVQVMTMPPPSSAPPAFPAHERTRRRTEQVIVGAANVFDGAAHFQGPCRKRCERAEPCVVRY